MSDAFRYRLVDEPRPGRLSRFALPPLLVFMVATFFLPWGYLFIAANALTLNGPRRGREVGLALAAVALYFAALLVLGLLIHAGLLANRGADYLFVAFVGVGLVLVAFAYVSQAHAFELRRYLQGPAR